MSKLTIFLDVDENVSERQIPSMLCGRCLCFNTVLYVPFKSPACYVGRAEHDELSSQSSAWRTGHKPFCRVPGE